MTRLTRALNGLANHACLLSPAGYGRVGGRHVCLVAHRGAHRLDGVIENTVAAFDPCLEAGVWGLELDIRWTRDGEPVVHHDPACGRTFGRPDIVIDRVSWEELQQSLPAVPHFSEVVERYGGRMHLMIEIKEDVARRTALAERVMELLQPLQPERDYHLMSLVPDDLEAFRDVPRAALVDVAWLNTARIIERNRKLGHGGVGGSFVLLGNRRLRQLRKEGRKIGTGFVDTPAALRREIHRGVDWIFTDNALAMQAVLDREGPGA